MQCDFYEPESDEWLSCQYLFRNLFMLRDKEAREINLGTEQLVTNEHLYLMARAGVKTDLVSGESAFLDKAVVKISEWMAGFAALKP